MAVATLSIDLVASLAKFEQGMRDAVSVAERASRGIDRAFTTSKIFAGNFLASAATSAISGIVQGATRLLPDLVNEVAGLQDIEEKTGAAAVAIAGMRTAADVAGLSVNDLAGYMVKLTGTLSKTVDEGKGAGLALKNLGIDAQAFRQLGPEEQFRLLAERMNAFRDGAGKTATALALFGKSGAELLPFLKELGQAGEDQIRLTAEQIQLADEYADRQAKVRSELRQAAQVAAIQALPAFTAFMEALRDTATAVTGLDKGVTDLSSNNTVGEWARDAARALGFVIDAGQGVARVFDVVGKAIGGSAAATAARIRGDVEEAQRITAEVDADIDRILQRPLFSEGLNRRLAEQASQAPRAPAAADTRPALALLDVPGAADIRGRDKALRAAQQQQRAVLDAIVKDLDRQLRVERDVVQFHNQFLDATYGQGLVDLRAYYDEKRALAERDLAAQLAAYEKERAAVQGALGRTRDPLERIRLQERLADIDDKSAKASQDAAQQRVLVGFEEQRAFQAAADQVVEFNARVAELNGNLEAAARMRAQLAIGQAQRSSAAIGLPQESIDAFAQATRRSTELGILQERLQRITAQSSIEEERLMIAAQQRGDTTQETERAIYDVRARNLQQLVALRDQVGAIAQAAGPDSPAAQFFAQLTLQAERAAAAVDPALQRMREFTQEFSDRAGQLGLDVVLDFRNAKESFRKFGSDITRMLGQELISKPLSDWLRQSITGLTNDSGSGLGEALRGIFGVQSGAGQGTAGAAGGGDSTGGIAGVLGGLFDAFTGSSVGSQVAGAVGGKGGAGAAKLDPALQNLSIQANAAANALQRLALTSGSSSNGGAINTLGSFLKAYSSSSSGSSAGSLVDLWGASAGGASASAGFSSGGFTGRSGSDATPAGVVHANEYVFSAPAVRTLGVARLEALHREARGNAPRLGLGGYANGGLVMPVMRAPVAAGNRTTNDNRTTHNNVHAYIGGGSGDTRTDSQRANQAVRAIRRAMARG